MNWPRGHSHDAAHLCDIRACDALRRPNGFPWAVNSLQRSRNRQAAGVVACSARWRKTVPLDRVSFSRLHLPARWLPSLATLLALTFGLLLWTEDADARLRDGLSLAGAGATAVMAIDSLIDFEGPFVPAVAAPSYPGGTLGEFFNRGDMIGAFAAGFLGAGVIGLLFGHGIVMELNGVASVLGLLFQLALIAMLGRLIWTWWHVDKAGTSAEMSPRDLADAYGRPRHEAVPDFDNAPSLEMTIDESADDGLGHPK